MKKKGIIAIIGIAVAAVLLLWNSTGQEKEYLQLDVFAGRANYQGMQEGWYAKIVEEKFNLGLNIIAPNVSGGGNLLFESRLSAGKVGDIIITSNANIRECINAGQLENLAPYLKKTEYLKDYLEVIESMNEAMGVENGIYFIPTAMSKMSPLDPVLYGNKPEIGSFIPWDYYRELGYPVIEDEEDLLEILTKMQENHPYTKDGKKTYAFSLYRDWDVGYMSLVATMARSFGYVDTTHTVFTTADLSETQRLIDDDGIYYRLLHLYYEANQRGLLDPESGVQNFDTMYEKARNKQVLYLWWAWMMGSYNDGAESDGYVFIPVSTEPVVCEGFSRYGDGYAYAVSADAKDVKRIVEYLDWMVSPEGMMYYAAGLEDVGYTYVDGKPIYKDFSLEAWKYGEELPEEYGGGSYSQGFCQFNDNIVQIKDINEEIGEPYYSENWSSTLEGNKGLTEQEWSAHFGYSGPAEYLKEKKLYEVVVKTDYLPEEESEELAVIREKTSSLIKEYSWKMIFAENDEQFKEYWADLKFMLYQSGYEKEVETDMRIIEEMRVHRQELLEKYK